ncbi:MAG: hypothetical protein ACRDBO_11530 [Lachnospiraceae bacterium]
MERVTEKYKFGWGIKSDEGLRVTLSGDCAAWDRAMERFAAYEDTGLMPEEIRHELETAHKNVQLLSGELLRLKESQQWIPVEERLPKDGTYLCTLDGELCGLDEPFTGMCGIKDGKWDEEDCVIAWMPLPDWYKPAN